MKTFKQYIAEELDAVHGAPPAKPAHVRYASADKKDPIGDLIHSFKRSDDMAALIKKHVEEPEKEFHDFFHRTLKYEGAKGEVTHDTGGMTKYGISSKAHPDVDIANLTKDQARDIYRKHYFDRMGKMDHLHPKVRAVALDAAVNQGLSHAKELVAAHGKKDNHETMIQARQAHYDHLATKNPAKYGKYHKGWTNRLNRLRADIKDIE